MTAPPRLGRVVVRLVVGSLLVAGAAACVLIGMWPELDNEAYWRATGCLAIGALEGAHASFVLAWRRDDDARSAVAATRVAVVAAAISCVMGVAPTAGLTSDSIDAEAYAELLGAVLVVQLVATADRIERIAAHPLVSDECERLRRIARAARAT
jgi:hypothetical protein